MYIHIVPNRESKPCVLLRESYRDEDGKTKNRTLSNLSHLPGHAIKALKASLSGELKDGAVSLRDSFRISKSLPHGHVKAILGTIKNIGLDKIVSCADERELKLVLGMIVSRIIEPRSKLFTARELNKETATSTLAEELEISKCSSDDLYGAMDWLHDRQTRIENKIAKKHLQDGALLLYDVTSTYFEGTKCPMAKYGHNRDGKKGKLQIVIGLLCAKDGCPIAVEIFEGNTKDNTTIHNQILKVKNRFNVNKVVIVGDRGMITNVEIENEFTKNNGIDWITCLRSTSIKKLLIEGHLQLSLFDELNKPCANEF